MLNITLGKILTLKNKAEADGTIGTWKKEVKIFAMENNLTNSEVITNTKRKGRKNDY